LFELANAVLCGDGPVRSPAEQSMAGECRRGRGGLHAAPVQGRIDPDRLRSDRVRRPAPPRQPHTRGRPPRHGGEFALGQPDTRGTPDTKTVTDTCLHGTATAGSRNRLRPRPTHRSSRATADGTLPVVEGTVIRLGIEHTFHLLKQTFGWTSPKIRTPDAVDHHGVVMCLADVRPGTDLGHVPLRELTVHRSRRRPRRRCPTAAIESSRDSGRPSPVSRPAAQSLQSHPKPSAPDSTNDRRGPAF
jgi:hypothetical protein